MGSEQLFRLRCPEGLSCPRCVDWSASATTRNRLTLASRSHEASLAAGTIFQDAREPLKLWFRAIWWVNAPKNAASAQGLQGTLGLGQCKTAWT